MPAFKAPPQLPWAFRVKCKHLIRHKQWPQLNGTHHSLVPWGPQGTDRKPTNCPSSFLMCHTILPFCPTSAQKVLPSSSPNLVNLTYLHCRVFPVLSPQLQSLFCTLSFIEVLDTSITLNLSAQTGLSCQYLTHLCIFSMEHKIWPK